MERKVYYSFHEIPFDEHSYGYGRTGIKFSGREIKELIISIIVLSLAFSIAMSSPHYFLFYAIFPMAFIAVVTAFAFHEISHKYAGMKFGYWSEYRMFPQGLLFALLLSFVGFVFAAPGAVTIYGNPSREENGIISAAGPSANIVIASLFLAISTMVTGIASNAISFIASINAFLAFFNLVPLGPLDGRKVFSWNIGIWGGMIAVSMILLALSWGII